VLFAEAVASGLVVSVDPKGSAAKEIQAFATELLEI